jgi:hypothetical protein
METTPDIDHLASLNAHSRDKRITIDPIPHTSTIDGDPSVKYTSVTTWNHSYFEEFDADTIINSKKWMKVNIMDKSRTKLRRGSGVLILKFPFYS